MLDGLHKLYGPRAELVHEVLALADSDAVFARAYKPTRQFLWHTVARREGRTGAVEGDGAVDHAADEGVRGLEVCIVFEQEQRVEVAFIKNISMGAQNAR